MEITQVEIFGSDELESRLRKVGLRKRKDVLVYAESDISIEDVPINDIHFAQYYVCKKDLEEIETTMKELKPFGVDIHNMEGFVRVFYRDDDGVCGVFDTLPPIVEVSKGDGGIKLLCDGMHRMFIARKLGLEKVKVVLIDEVDYPYYALPNESGWNDVQVVDSPPDVKKRYRIEDYKSVFRDFNTAFLNVSQVRK